MYGNATICDVSLVAWNRSRIELSSVFMAGSRAFSGIDRQSAMIAILLFIVFFAVVAVVAFVHGVVPEV